MAVKIECGFWVLAPYSVMVGYQHFTGLKVQAAWTSKTLVSNHNTICHDNPESYEPHHQCYESGVCVISISMVIVITIAARHVKFGIKIASFIQLPPPFRTFKIRTT
jgi:hypothetical protein